MQRFVIFIPDHRWSRISFHDAPERNITGKLDCLDCWADGYARKTGRFYLFCNKKYWQQVSMTSCLGVDPAELPEIDKNRGGISSPPGAAATATPPVAKRVWKWSRPNWIMKQYKPVEFLSNFRMSPPPPPPWTNVNPPSWKLSGDGSVSCAVVASKSTTVGVRYKLGPMLRANDQSHTKAKDE